MSADRHSDGTHAQRPGDNRHHHASEVLVDPGFFEILGALTELLGLSEHLQKLLPLDRRRMMRRHRRIESQKAKCGDAITRARTALRVLQAFAKKHMSKISAGTFGVPAPSSELSVYRQALGDLQRAVQDMTNATYELEAATLELPRAHEQYFQLSQNGRETLQKIAGFLSAQGPMEGLSDLLAEVEHTLERTWRLIFEERFNEP